MTITFGTASVCRYDERGGPAPGRARVPDAVSPRLPQGPVRDHARVLEEGGDGATDVRDPAVEARRVLQPRGYRLQGSGECAVMCRDSADWLAGYH